VEIGPYAIRSGTSPPVSTTAWRFVAEALAENLDADHRYDAASSAT
jgi:hypothetical protein